MAKRKKSSRCPQPRHKKSQKSGRDKRKRMERRNRRRQRTTTAKFPLVGMMVGFVMCLQSILDARSAFRLGIMISGMLLADGRRTVSSWLIAAGVKDDWDRYYDLLQTIGRCVPKLATAVLYLVICALPSSGTRRITVAIDDSPTPRYGPHVEGAGVHHNPTPGPADGEWLYGHNFVCLAWLQSHPLWGVIAFPLVSMMYVRKQGVEALVAKYGPAWEFRTKLELGVAMMTWFVEAIRQFGSKVKVWVAVDGAYAAKPFLAPLLELGVVAVCRLRKDACLFDLPASPKPHQRGRRPIYGKNRLSLSRRAASKKGWSSITYRCRGVEVTRQYKTFLATSRLVSGVIRVVIVRFEDQSWAPYFCTDASADVREILETVAARWAIEEQFHDVKEVWGAGQQQVRNVWSNLACWNLNGWLYNLVELCCWERSHEELVDRSDRSWDNEERRPSHFDRRRTIAREMLRNPILAALPSTLNRPDFRILLEHVIALAA